MGFELNRLMQRFGVSSPSMSSYAGAAQPAAGTSSAQYDADRAEYQNYQDRYRQALSSGSMYNSPQFNAGLPGVFTGVSANPVVTGPSYTALTTGTGTGTGTTTGTGTGAATGTGTNTGTGTGVGTGVTTGSGSGVGSGAGDRVSDWLNVNMGNDFSNIGEFSQPYTPPNFGSPIQSYTPPQTLDINSSAMQSLPTQQPVYNTPAYEASTYVPATPAAQARADAGNNRLEDFSNIGDYSSTYAPNFGSPVYTYTPPQMLDIYGGGMQALPDYNTPAYEAPTYTASQVNTNTGVQTTPAALRYDYDTAGGGGGSAGDFMSRYNVDMYSHGGEVKKFAVGGLNDLADGYGITSDAGIRMLPGQEAYGYGPRPKQGPLGPWIEQVVTEVVPGVTIAGRARTPERNREVGGVPDSYHLTDNARDIRPPKGMTQGELLAKLKGEFGSDFDVLTSKGSSVHVEPGPTLGKTTRSGAPATPVTPSAELGNLTPEPSGGATAPTGRAAELKMLLDGYEGESAYAEELKTARAKAAEEADAFKSMLEASLESPEDAKASKAEMYFRLAAAFGSPTKTGGFGENLGLASKEMAEYSKGKRESSREKLATKLKLQELRMGAAKEELGTLRALSAEEMKDKRVMTQALIKDYIESGKPQSAAGKQALDEGYQPGTPEFQARVRELAALDVARETAQLQALIGNLKINESRERREAGKEGKLTPKELDLKLATEDSLAAIRSAMGEIAEAYRLNPNSFDNSLPDLTRRKALELAGSQDPMVVNTGALENLLKSQTITSAAEKMKGVLSDSDIKLIMSIGGLDAKSKAERATILRNAYIKMKEGESRMARRLQQISSGAYREISGD